MNPVQAALAGVTVGHPTKHRNLQVYPLYRRDESPPRYLTLDEALQLEGFVVKEVSDQGSVPDLKVVNKLDQPVLLVDGEELVGAKQNRVLNLTVLVAAHSEVVIPVSCVEAGRWRHTTSEFTSAARTHYAEGRAAKMRQVSASLLRSEGPRSAQAEVWADIARKQQRLGVDSPTRAMGDMYESVGARIEEYVAAFPPEEHQTGAVFVLNGEITGMDLTDSPAAFHRLFAKLVRSHALDALEHLEPGSAAGTVSPGSFLEVVKASHIAQFAAVGLGVDLRLSGAGADGAGLLWDGQLVHLSAFPSESAAGVG